MPIWLTCLYWTVAVVLSLYYAYRGYVGNWSYMREKNDQRCQKHRFSDGQIIRVYCVHDALWHLLSALAGFVALAVAFKICKSIDLAQPLDTGKSLLLTFSFLFGFIGATGQLPMLLQQGKFPYFK